VMTPIVGRSLSAGQRARRKARLVSLVESLPEAKAVGEQHCSLQVRGQRPATVRRFSIQNQTTVAMLMMLHSALLPSSTGAMGL
jgi:hypothetical protein